MAVLAPHLLRMADWIVLVEIEKICAFSTSLDSL